MARKVFPAAGLFSILRDFTSRGSYILLVNALFNKYRGELSKNIDLKYHVYFGSALCATLISHPFDVMFTKIASQRSAKYVGVLGTIKTIYRDEGFGKMYSGIDYRLLYNLVSIIIMGNCYDSLMNIAIDAF